MYDVPFYQDVATYINQVKRDDENQKTVRDIQNR